VTYDDESKFLYLLGGQLGGGCNVVSNKALRIHVVSKKTQILPNLPEGRYAAGSAVLRPAVNSTTAHVHIFGGASPLRNMTARQHWRLEISDDFGDGDTFVTAAAAGSPSTALTSWEELEPVPDSNSHGVTFEHEGYIYHGSALNNDFGMQPTENIDVCRANNQLGVDSHHTTSMGAIWRYASMRSSASPSRKGHWERIQDMPIPAGQALVVKVNDSFLVVGGSNTQREDGSTGTVIPNTWVRVFHPRRQEWDILSPLAKPTKFGGMAWFDSSTEKVYVVRHNNNRPKRPLFNEGTIFNVTIGTVRQAKSFQAKYLLDKEYRRIGVEGFQKCLAERVNDNGFKNVTLFDPAETYDQARKTWNLRQNHLQVPNVIAYPKNEEHVSAIIQCAKRNGFKVCGRNGKHSFEGHTCSFGVVVDTSYLNHIELMDYAKGQVRLGAGLTLGKVAVEVEEGFNLVFPMGHCATVGVTGLMLVGGQGVLSRHFGMTIDYVSAIELVDESGLLIRATADNEFSDFLWLARGGGSGVQHFPGIITSIEFSGLPQPEKPASSAITTTSAGTGEKATKKAKVYTSFNIEFEPTVENAAQLLLAWQEFYRDDRHIEDPLFSRLTVEPWLRLKPNSLNGSNSNADGYERQLYLACYFYGNEEYHQQFMDVYYPKLVNLLPPSLWSSNESNGGYVTVSKVNRLSNVAFHKRLSGVRTKGQLASGQDGWDLDKRWKGYSAVARDSSVSEDAFRILAQSIYESQPFTERYVEMKPLGGAISSVPQDATSFGYREAKWWLLTSHFMLESDFHKSDNNVLHTIDHVRKERHSRATMILNNSRNQHNHFLDAMQDSFGGFYAGYIDQGSSTGRDLELYYSQSHAKKIADIKLRRDPHNLFHLYLPNAMDESSNYRHNL
jgi:FAD/FMN-containing dehydrogenase